MSGRVIPMMTVVNGREAFIDVRDPIWRALTEFYRAFNNRDLALLERNWISSDDASMAAPLGGIRHGWPDIREGYERLFRSAALVSLDLRNYAIHNSGEIFYAVGREQGIFSPTPFPWS